MYSILNNPSVKAKVNELLSNMTLAQKIGQMTQAERLSCTPTEAKNFHLGSLMCGQVLFPVITGFKIGLKWLIIPIVLS